MRRASFLTIFLTTLSVAFAVALVIRIRSYRDAPPDARTPPAAVEFAAPPPTQAPATYTLQSLDEHGANVASPAVAARARRRAEILREAQATPAPLVNSPNTTTAKPSTIKPAPVPPKTVAVRTQQPAPPARTEASRPIVASPSAPGSSRSSGAQTTTAPKDPNSDTAPPQLLGIDFDPPQVHDGEEAHVIMNAIDDLSGIRGISGTIVSPTGKALQGFAGQRDGETNRYIGRFVVPKNGEEGIWRVNIVTMSDNASNSTTLSLAQNTLPVNAGLRVVSSASDSTPPTLKSVRAEKRSMHIGEPNPIYIEAEDDKSGVNLVSAVFQSPNKKARIGAGCRRGEGDQWQCELSLPSCIDCGDWQLEQVTLQDKANNLATFRTDNPIVASLKINIGGDSCDSEAPRMQTIAFDQNVVTLGGAPAVVTVTITATDDACGVEGVSGQYSGPGTGSGGFFPFQKAGDEQTWTARIPLDPRAPRGVWRINSIQLTDKGHNLRIYYANDPLLANATFQVR